MGDETRREETRWKRKGTKEKRKEEMAKEQRKISRLENMGEGERVIVIIREKKGVRQGRIERGRKDDVEPAGHLPT